MLIEHYDLEVFRAAWSMGMMNSKSRPCHIWLTLEEPDIIELKQVALDRDAPGALAFFQRVVLPRVGEAARRRGIGLNGLAEEQGDERLPG